MSVLERLQEAATSAWFDHWNGEETNTADQTNAILRAILTELREPIESAIDPALPENASAPFTAMIDAILDGKA